MAFWAAAQLQPNRTKLALHCLELAGFEVYNPRLRLPRRRDRKILPPPQLFPSYCFVLIKLQWHAAHRAPGVIRLVLDGWVPARVPDAIIAALRARERNGLIELPRRPAFQPGDRVRVCHGPFEGQLATFVGMKPRQRIEILLSLLGGHQRVELASEAVEVISSLTPQFGIIR